MIRKLVFSALLASAAFAGPVSAQAPTLKMITIDVEGGGGTIFLTPEGQTLLIDTGNPTGSGTRDAPDGAKNSADRIMTAARALGITRIDFLITTHYHSDHVGGLEDLMKLIPIGTFIDHGPNIETEKPGDDGGNRRARSTIALYAKYVELTKGHQHIVAKPGDVFHFGSLTDTIVASGGEFAKPLPGAGKRTAAAACAADPYNDDGGIENAHSVASLLTFGKVKIAAFGDLVWNKEHDLFCPLDRVGKVNIMVLTHHGARWSGHPAAFASLRPDIAIMGNSNTKGGDPVQVNGVNSVKNLQGFWKLHASTNNAALNGDENYIANVEPPQDHGRYIRLDITRNGSVTVTNSRNAFTRTYQVK